LPEKTDLPIDYEEGANVGYKWYAAKGVKPLFAFGEGLSYTRFAHSGLKVSGGSDPSVTLTVKNIGERSGFDVPQAYLVSTNGKPVRRLIGFSRVELAPGQSRTVTMKVAVPLPTGPARAGPSPGANTTSRRGNLLLI